MRMAEDTAVAQSMLLSMVGMQSSAHSEVVLIEDIQENTADTNIGS